MGSDGDKHGAEVMITFSVDDGVGLLTLDDPSRRNAVSAALSVAVRSAVRPLAPDVRALVLAANGPAFSAGGDIDSLTRRDVPLPVLYEGFQAISALPIPTIAAVDGPAVGAGMNWALACDVIIASPKAAFDPRFLDIGIHPGGGHLWRLTRLVGRQAAAAMVLCGESVSGQDAVTIGLAWRCVDDPVSFALALARRVAGRSDELVRRTKATLDASAALTHEEAAVELEQQAQEWSMTRPAFAEGVARLRARLQRKDATA